MARSVRFDGDEGATGWNAPPTAPWLERALDEASKAFYGKPSAAMGEGGTIPFMAMLGKHFPQAQFLITGVLGPKSNAHGPNEFLHVPYATKLTACVATRARRARGAQRLDCQRSQSTPHDARGGVPSGNTSCLPRASVRIRSRAMSASNAGRGGASMSRPSSPSSLRGAEPAPVADHVHVGAIAEHRPLANRGEPGEGPARNRVRAPARRARRS